VFYIYIFIHQYGSAQKENTNIQTKSSIKNTTTAVTDSFITNVLADLSVL